VWGLALIGGALLLYSYAAGTDTPVVVLALSVASITYGALLGAYILAGRWSRADGRDLILAVTVTMLAMLVVVFARRLAGDDSSSALATLGRLAWPWYVPLGTLLAVSIGTLSSLLRGSRRNA
jgi:hypothetical protein